MSQEIETTVDNMRALASIQAFAGDDQMRDIASYEDALALAEAVHGDVLDIAEELGTGFVLLKDKGKLVDQEFVLVQWRFTAGEFSKMFVSAALVTKTGDKYIITDGSSGIMDQLFTFSQDQKRFGGVRVHHGLRVSAYDTCAECGRPRSKDEVVCSNEKCGDETDRRSKGETYYLDLTPAAKN